MNDLYRTTLDIMKADGVKLLAVCWEGGYVLFDDDTIVPITFLWGPDGEAVDSWKDAVVCEFGNDWLGYGTVLVDEDVEKVTVH